MSASLVELVNVLFLGESGASHELESCVTVCRQKQVFVADFHSNC